METYEFKKLESEEWNRGRGGCWRGLEYNGGGGRTMSLMRLILNCDCGGSTSLGS